MFTLNRICAAIVGLLLTCPLTATSHAASVDTAVMEWNQINRTSGAIVESGDFGRVISTRNNPRLVQLALKISFWIVRGL